MAPSKDPEYSRRRWADDRDEPLARVQGEVYRARDPRLGREVAVKVLPSSFSSDARRLHRFEQEAPAAGMLNHPNVLAIYDVGTHEGSPYLVSELLEGETLRARLSAGALPLSKVFDYAVQVSMGLAAAHEKSIVHRDLKPENLFVTRDGRVKILDFGLAKLTSPDREDRTDAPTIPRDTDPGVVMGTVGYMAPEQVRGQEADARSDVFALGAIVYEMLTGRRAFRRDTPVETMNAILTEDPPEAADANPALTRLVKRCLEKRPEERFQSARDLGFALE
ncbi:MAG: serine/threonine-protein kinase, partial [Vicinamibacteria bacterium]